jgi:SP family general alpha glucoside:H+ symporter-like MFS transporter
LIVLQLVWQMTLGPLTYVVVCENPSTKLCSKTIAIATSFDAVTALVTTIIGPYLLNPGAANASAEIKFLYGSISVFCNPHIPKLRCVEKASRSTSSSYSLLFL